MGDEIQSYLQEKLGDLVRFFRQRCCCFQGEIGSTKKEKFSRYRSLLLALRDRFELGVYNLNHDTVALTALDSIYTGFDRANGSFEAAQVQRRSSWDFLYHLHGSVHFSLGRPSWKDRAAPTDLEICWMDKLDENGRFRDAWPPRDAAEGRWVMESALVAGGWKLDQLQMEPFQTFYSTLPRHAHEADAVLIAGYGFGDEHVNSVLANMLKARAGRRPPVLVLDKKGAMERLHQCEQAHGYEWRECYGRSAWLGDLANTLGVLCPRFVRAEGLAVELASSDSAEGPPSGDYDRCVEPAYPVAVWSGGMLEAAERKDEIANWLLGHVPGR